MSYKIDMSVTFHEATSIDTCFFCKDQIKGTKALIATSLAKQNLDFINMDLQCLQQIAELMLKLVYDKAWQLESSKEN